MYSKELTRQIHQKLLPELLEAIASEKTIESINSIADRNDLSIGQTNKLSTVLTWRLMGLVKEAEFASKIESEVGVGADRADQIYADISKEILSLIPLEIFKKQEENTAEILKTISSTGPVIITQENKEEALKQLENRADQQKNSIPEIPPQNLPMVEPGEIAHEIPHDPKLDKFNKLNKEEETKPQTPVRQAQGEPPSGPKYPDGKDPYREPLI